MHRNLIISPIGARSQHRTWIGEPAARQFDLFLIDYADQPSASTSDAEYYVRRGGFKFEHLAYVAEEHTHVLEQYDAIWCPDDDIAADTATVNRMFELFHQYELQLAQPAIAAGQVSYRGLLQRPRSLLRYTPYVEVMCPIFSLAAFFRAATTFRMNRSGWGMDWVWTKLFDPSEMAILDSAAVHHTGILGTGEHYQKLAALGIDPWQDFHAAVESVGGIDWEVHRQMVEGTIRLPIVPLPGSRSLRGWWSALRSPWRRAA